MSSFTNKSEFSISDENDIGLVVITEAYVECGDQKIDRWPPCGPRRY